MKDKIKKSSIYACAIRYFMMFAIVVDIPFFERVTAMSTIQTILELVVDIVILSKIIKKSKINSYNILLFVLLLIYILSTIVSSGNIKGVLSESLDVLSLSLIIEYGLKSKRDSLINGAYGYFAVVTIINLATIIVFPEGLYETSNLQYSTKMNWFLGYRNLHILFLFQLILWGAISDITKSPKFSWRTKLAVIVSAVTVVAVKSTTSSIGVILVIGLLLLVRFVRNAKIVRIYNFLLLYVISFSAVVLLRLQDKYDDFIFLITGKHSDFTGRTYIWDSVIQFIKERPLIGYGKEVSAVRESKTVIWQAAHAHNGLLELIYRIGMVGGILTAVLVLRAFRELSKYKNEMIAKILVALIASMSIMLLTEYYSPQFVIPLITISYNIRYLINEEEKNNC